MAHQTDLHKEWPPSELVAYLDNAPSDGPVISVLPRPRATWIAAGGLAYLDLDDLLVKLARARGIPIGYGGRTDNDLTVVGAFSADEVIEIALGIAQNAAWDVIKAGLGAAALLLGQRLHRPDGERRSSTVRIGLRGVTKCGISEIVVEAATPDEAVQAAEEVLRVWFEVDSEEEASGDTDPA